MSFPNAHYQEDSDADDEYERSVLTSPMPPTDDETSSIGDSEHGGDTPTTFEADGYGRPGPRKLITQWSVDECAAFLNSIGLGQYSRHFRENEIVGEAIVEIHHDELKEMGVKSMGHRLTILGAIYETKVKQDVDVEPDHYVPPSKEEDMRSRQATQDDLSRIIQSLQLRDQRIKETEAALLKMQEKYDKLRQELLPVFKMAKERNGALPSPVQVGFGVNGSSNGANQLTRGNSQSKNQKNLKLSATPSISPTWPSADRSAGSDPSVLPSSAVSATQNAMRNDLAANLGSSAANTANALNGLDIGHGFPSPNNQSPGVSPGVHHQQQINKDRGYGSVANSYDTTQYALAPSEEHRWSKLPSARGEPSRRNNPTPSMMQSDPDKVEPPVEVFKSFRVSMDDPCYKVLPAALKKYNIDADWKQYALYIVYGDQERCLGLEEKPLILFKQLDKEGRKPMFMLRRHVTPEHGFTGPNTGGAGAFGQSIREATGSKIQLPGGVL